jgi:hypothetical protein
LYCCSISSPTKVSRYRDQPPGVPAFNGYETPSV